MLTLMSMSRQFYTARHRWHDATFCLVAVCGQCWAHVKIGCCRPSRLQQVYALNWLLQQPIIILHTHVAFCVNYTTQRVGLSRVLSHLGYRKFQRYPHIFGGACVNFSMVAMPTFCGASFTWKFKMAACNSNLRHRRSCIGLGLRGGATVLKVGGKNFFWPPHFLASGGGTKYCLDS